VKQAREKAEEYAENFICTALLERRPPCAVEIEAYETVADAEVYAEETGEA